MEANSPIPILLNLSLSLLIFLSTAEGACHPSEESALLAIKKAFYHPKSDAFSDWSPRKEPNCCKWSDVLTCNSHGRVTWLRLEPFVFASAQQIPAAVGEFPFLEQLEIYGNLTGPIPAAVGNLGNVHTLQIGGGVTGKIPESFGKLKKLKYLDLSGNKLTAFPASFGQLGSLVNLNAGNNKFYGPVPESLSQLKQVEMIYLADNRFSGSVPGFLSQLPKLSWLDLSANRLTGPIPASFGSFKPRPNGNPVWVTLSRNRLSGPLPKSLAQANVSRLELSMNQLTGDASFLFGKEKAELEAVKIDHNYFKFDFAKVDLPLGLKELDIRNNEIYGSLPKNLGQVALKALNVSHNSLCGEIPTGRRLKQFRPDAFGHNKCLCGVPLPACK